MTTIRSRRGAITAATIKRLCRILAATRRLITSVERRRRRSQDEKERLVAAPLEPGASVSEVARMAGFM